MQAKRKSRLLLLSLMLAAGLIFYPGRILSQGQTDSCYCITDSQVQGFEIARIELNSFKEAYFAEHETRLLDSASYTFLIGIKDKSYRELNEAFKLEQVKPKVIQVMKTNPDWYWFTLGGTVLGGIIVWAFQHYVFK